MHIKLRKTNQVSMHQQLSSQLLCAILSQEFKPGSKLLSTNGLARYCKVCRNTVTQAYCDLASYGMVKSYAGSGVFVQDCPDDFTMLTHQHVHQFINEVLGLAHTPPNHFLVIEPNAERRLVFVSEIEEATVFPTKGVSLDECANPDVLKWAFPVTMWWQLDRVRAVLPEGKVCLGLRLNSTEGILNSITAQLPESLIALISNWQEFLEHGRNILVAHGADAEALSTYNVRTEVWKDRLARHSLVITDNLTAKLIPQKHHPLVFRTIHDESIEDLRRYKQSFTS